ncbi:SusC/RagA family TonB-linked outer membrane protein [Solitalea lacus]|uniref:SusC/RagA family TonB-linked outer membrane protein n=1 Tax=Solitalea lacus TaxID=2911172 RepID=UPI001EDA1BF3|nr:SusC/RagA family TonB-linked outer membrane protein [Solitalea lacus]UKJ07416.1 SusC/RagA family TonB-linked outer membrane protein [Solitalea lacus]
MKKKFTKFLVLLFSLLTLTTYAQQKKITGTVLSKDDGLPLPGVSVVVKGSSLGTQTNVDGKYSIAVPEKATLIFNYIGFKTKEVAVGSSVTINISLDSDTKQLGEVVVTGAYGIQSSSRTSASNAQVVTSKQLNTIRTPSMDNALAGKVAGLQVRSQSAAALGRQTDIRLRGATGFGTGNGALYVVDGTILPTVDDINMDDVDNVSVLQGPAASALFGSQGANGAIVITMKKGKTTDGFGVTLNTGVMIENVNRMPNYQNSYAGGSSSDLMKYTWKDGDPAEWKALDGKYYHDYSDDASWGPRMVGQEYIPWYAWYGGHSRSFQTAKLTAQPNNAREFFNTGVGYNSSISFSKATENLNFKFTYGNQNTNGLLPSSGLKKNSINLISSYKISKDLDISANITYVNRGLNGEIVDDYSNQSSGSFNQWFHRDLDMGIMKELRNLRTPEGIYASWNHSNPSGFDPTNTRNFYAGNYWYNFYTWFDLININNQRDRLFGNVALTYNITKDLKVSATYRKQQNTTFLEQKYSSRLNESGLQTTGNSPEAKGYYETFNSYSNRRNIEFLASYTKEVVKDIKVDANVGTDFFRLVSKSNGASTNNGLSLPDLFTVQNSVDPATMTNGRVEEKYRAVFGRANIGYKNFLSAEVTLRNDWYSTLPTSNNSVLSKGFGGSFIFSELLPQKTFSWLSFGKLRASWGEIPKALGTDNDNFGAYRYPGMTYGVGQFKWGSNMLMGTPDVLVDPNIHGSVVTQREIGLDLRFMNDRFGVSATYWDGNERDFPYELSVNGASGYTKLLTNIGKISKQGMEFQLSATPIRSDKFKWDLTAAWSPLIKNDVDELSKEYQVSQTASVGQVYGSTTGMPYMIHEEGKRWGQLFGNGIKRNANGVPILNDEGMYLNDPKVYFGSVLPTSTGGLQNSFTILRDFTVRANIDYQIGGKFVSLSNMWGSYSGLTARTATVNDKGNPIRDAVADGGGVHVFGVDATDKPVDYYVEAQDYFHQSWGTKVFDEYVYDLTFVKLREVSVGYEIPVRKLKLGSYIKNANFSVVAKNPVLIYSKNRDFDPSEIDAVYGETGQLPGTRGFGFNLRIGF